MLDHKPERIHRYNTTKEQTKFESKKNESPVKETQLKQGQKKQQVMQKLSSLSTLI